LHSFTVTALLQARSWVKGEEKVAKKRKGRSGREERERKGRARVGRANPLNINSDYGPGW